MQENCDKCGRKFKESEWRHVSDTWTTNPIFSESSDTYNHEEYCEECHQKRIKEIDDI